MGIYLFEVSQEERQYFEDNMREEKLHFCDEPLTSVEQASRIAADAEAISVFIHSTVSAEIIGALPNLGLISTRSTGYDHVDLAAAAARGITVSTVPTYGDNTVAEHTFGLILALSRNIHKAFVRTVQGDFSLGGLQGFDLKGKTLGIIGVGRIGLHVARIARAFEMDVIAYDAKPNANMADVLGYSYVGLNELLRRSDIVTLHAPLTSDTYHLIGEAQFRQFKRGALLINTARGELIDTSALLKALDAKQISGAGLDVLEGEAILSEEDMLASESTISRETLQTTLRNLSLLRRQDLVVTPHIGFDSREAVQRILDTTIDNIRAYRAGHAINAVVSDTA